MIKFELKLMGVGRLSITYPFQKILRAMSLNAHRKYICAIKIIIKQLEQSK